MRDKPKLIKLNNTPLIKDVKKIPLPPVKPSHEEVSNNHDIYIRPDNDSIYHPIKNEDNKQNHS